MAHAEHHHHHHGHHHHAHAHGAAAHGHSFAIGIALNSVYVAFELTFGFLVGSLGLIADAVHNASDVLSLVVAWGASRLAGRSPSMRFTYGLKRSPILASLFNALLLVGAMGAIAYEAVRRLLEPSSSVSGVTIMWVSGIGLLVNAGTALLFMRGRKQDLNIQGAFLHMAADAAVTLGVLIAGAVIFLTDWRWVDPAIGLVVVAVVLWSTWGLARDALKLSLDAVPAGTDIDAIQDYLQQVEGVREVHDLHVWPLSTTETALTAHLVMPHGVENPDALIGRICSELHQHHGIEHATVQIEHGDVANPCGLAPSEVV